MKYLLLIAYLFFQVSYANLLSEGDSLYKQRQEIQNVEKALDLYQNFLKKNKNSSDALWRISMTYYYLGHKSAKSSRREKYFRKGVDFGNKCAAISKRKKVECIFWLATNTALLNKELGVLSLAFGIGEMIDLFEESRKLDDDYASSGPYRMLALLYFKAPGFLGGDENKAFEYIKKAIKRSPNEPLNVYFYLTFLVKDKQSEKAFEIAKQFKSQANPKNFQFYESESAYTKIVYFIENRRFPRK